MKKLLPMKLSFIFFFLINSFVWAQVPTYEKQKIVSNDPIANGQFGISSDISGDYAVTGAIGADSFKGAIYVFYNDGHSWDQIAKLTMSDAMPNDYFGHSVAISGDYIVAGCADKQATYIYKKPASGWANMTETQKIVASDAQADDIFGYSVAIDADYIVVGDHYQDNGGSLTDDKGAAYVFHNNAGVWQEEQKLVASDATNEDYFGCDVSISDNIIIAGAKGKDDGADYAGAAYIFENDGSGWSQEAKLTASDPETSDGLGFTVDVYGNYAIASAYWKNVSGVGSGAAYVYKKPASGWVDMTQIAKLTPSDGVEYDYFSRNIAITDQYAVASAHYEHNGGQVYFYEMPGSGWEDMTESKILKPTSTTVNYGKSLSLTNDRIIVGDFGDASYAGAAFIYAPEESEGLDESLVNLFSIYPNPSKGILKIKLNDNKIDKTISYAISDGLGKLIKQASISKKTTQINLSLFDKGLYFIKINSSEGSVTYKFILD